MMANSSDNGSAALTTPVDAPGGDPFALLGVPRRYSLDEAALRRAWMDRSRQLHPDRHVGLGEAERTQLVSLAARVNDAYAVLADPMRRADCLLMLCGGPAAHDHRHVSPGLLGQVMLWRETISDLGADASAGPSDAAARQSVLEQVRAMRSDRASRLKLLADALSDPGQSSDIGARRDMRVCLNELRYLDNLLDELARP